MLVITTDGPRVNKNGDSLLPKTPRPLTRLPRLGDVAGNDALPIELEVGTQRLDSDPYLDSQLPMKTRSCPFVRDHSPRSSM